MYVTMSFMVQSEVKYYIQYIDRSIENEYEGIVIEIRRQKQEIGVNIVLLVLYSSSYPFGSRAHLGQT